MPSVTAQRHTAGVTRCLWRGTWAQLTLQATVLVLLLTTKYGAARPALMDYPLPGGEFAQRPATAADTNRFQGVDLRSLCSRTQSLEMRVLCKLTQREDSWSAVEGRKRLVNKRSDGSSLSAFQRFVSQLRIAAQDRSDAMHELQQLRNMGVLDENDQIISLPDETRSQMERLG